MDPAVNSTQFLGIFDKLCFTLNDNVDIVYKLKAIAMFELRLFYKPWLKGAPAAAERLSEVKMFEKTLSERLQGGAS